MIKSFGPQSLWINSPLTRQLLIEWEASKYRPLWSMPRIQHWTARHKTSRVSAVIVLARRRDHITALGFAQKMWFDPIRTHLLKGLQKYTSSKTTEFISWQHFTKNALGHPTDLNPVSKGLRGTASSLGSLVQHPWKQGPLPVDPLFSAWLKCNWQYHKIFKVDIVVICYRDTVWKNSCHLGINVSIITWPTDLMCMCVYVCVCVWERERIS